MTHICIAETLLFHSMQHISRTSDLKQFEERVQKVILRTVSEFQRENLSCFIIA